MFMDNAFKLWDTTLLLLLGVGFTAWRRSMVAFFLYIIGVGCMVITSWEGIYIDVDKDKNNSNIHKSSLLILSC